MVSLIAGLKMEGVVKWRGLKLEGPLYTKPEGLETFDSYC